jgi:hypothetical protein
MCHERGLECFPEPNYILRELARDPIVPPACMLFRRPASMNYTLLVVRHTKIKIKDEVFY